MKIYDTNTINVLDNRFDGRIYVLSDDKPVFNQVTIKYTCIAAKEENGKKTFDISFIADNGIPFDEIYEKVGEDNFRRIENKDDFGYHLKKVNSKLPEDESWGGWNVNGDNFEITVFSLIDGRHKQIPVSTLFVPYGSNKTDIAEFIPDGFCLRDDKDFWAFNKHYKEIAKDGTVTEHKALRDSVRLTDEEHGIVAKMLKVLDDYCSEHKIKIGIDQCNGGFLAGHVDEITYDCFDEDNDIHMPVYLLEHINSNISYIGEEDEFVLKGAKKKD